jgi:hypothetical protein
MKILRYAQNDIVGWAACYPPFRLKQISHINARCPPYSAGTYGRTGKKVGSKLPTLPERDDEHV